MVPGALSVGSASAAACVGAWPNECGRDNRSTRGRGCLAAKSPPLQESQPHECREVRYRFRCSCPGRQHCHDSLPTHRDTFNSPAGERPPGPRYRDSHTPIGSAWGHQRYRRSTRTGNVGGLCDRSGETSPSLPHSAGSLTRRVVPSVVQRGCPACTWPRRHAMAVVQTRTWH